MKRFGMYNEDFNNLFDCYARVSPGLVVERQLPSETRKPVSIGGGDSFPRVNKVKIFIQRPGRGADLAHVIDIKSVDSDNHDGGVMITGTEGDRLFNINTTKVNAQVRVIDSQGNIENEFVTNVQPKYDSNTRELSVIHVEAL